jgi:hypothetical protein
LCHNGFRAFCQPTWKIGGVFPIDSAAEVGNLSLVIDCYFPLCSFSSSEPGMESGIKGDWYSQMDRLMESDSFCPLWDDYLSLRH